MPDIQDAVTGLVAWFSVLGPVIERLALHGPLLFAVVAGDDLVVTGALACIGSHQGWPVGCAGSVAHRFATAADVVVKRIECHFVFIGYIS